MYPERETNLKIYFWFDLERLGCMAGVCLAPLRVGDLRGKCVEGSYTRACKIGQVVRDAQMKKGDAAKAVADMCGGKILFKGKVTDIARRTEGGFTIATVTLEGIDESANKTFAVEIQNENIVAFDGSGKVRLKCFL